MAGEITVPAEARYLVWKHVALWVSAARAGCLPVRSFAGNLRRAGSPALLQPGNHHRWRSRTQWFAGLRQFHASYAKGPIQ